MVKYPFKCIYMSWIFRNRRGGKVSRLTPSSVKTNCTKYSNVFRKQHSSFRRYVKDHVYAPECIRKTSSVCLRRSVRTCRRSSSFFIVHKVNLKNCEGAAAEPSCPAFYPVTAFRHGRSSALTLQQRDDEYISIFFLWLRPGETRREPGNQSYSFSRKIHHKWAVLQHMHSLSHPWSKWWESMLSLLYSLQKETKKNPSWTETIPWINLNPVMNDCSMINGL